MSYTKLKNKTMGRNIGKSDMAFVIFYCKYAKPYRNYDQFSKERRDMNIPLIFMNSRFDGRLGFVGGNVDSTDPTLEDAVAREALEEVNFRIDKSRLKHFTTFANSTRHITSFLYELSEEEMLNLYRSSTKAVHFGSENCGSILWQVNEKSVNQLTKNNFSGTAKEELQLIIDILYPFSEGRSK